MVLMWKNNARTRLCDIFSIFIYVSLKSPGQTGKAMMLVRRVSNCRERQGALWNRKISLVTAHLTRANEESVGCTAKSRATNTHF